MKTTVSLTCLLILTSVSFVIAQDVIIKNDKSEIKSKVMEITDSQIKYKKWDNIDGPIYNLLKSEVFMIIYANGQRETIGKVPVQKEPEIIRQKEIAPIQMNSQNLDSLKIGRVNYSPYRLIIGTQSPFEVGLDAEVRLVKNFLNLGITFMDAFPKDEDILNVSFYSLYGSIYLPVNRIMKNYQNQDKGLFIFCHPGISFNGNKIYNSKTYQTETNYSNLYFTFNAGVDYIFSSKGFGITLSSYNFQSYYLGICFRARNKR